MIDFSPILNWELALFLKINQEWSNALFDVVLPYLRNKYFWIPLYIFTIAFFGINYKWKGWLVIVMAICTVGLADTASSKVLKPTFNRVRPCNDEAISQQMTLRVHCGAGKSFPSSHATNHFAFAIFWAMLLGHKWRWLWPVGILWAGSISYSQVYVGVHYPVDVSAGTLLGASIGALLGYMGKVIFGNLESSRDT